MEAAIIEIALTRGHVSLLYESDWNRQFTYNFRNGETKVLNPSEIRWLSLPNRNHFYAASTIDGRFVTLHRLITECPSHLLVDHKGSTLDNRRHMLRVCNHTENGRNHRPYKKSESKLIGVSVNRSRRKPWKAQIHIRVDGRPITKTLGTFASEEDAARAYDRAALEHFGEFARLNFNTRTPAISEMAG